MRPSRTVAIAVLTAALAVGALPGLAGSREPSPDRPIAAVAFRQVNLASGRDRYDGSIAAFDAAFDTNAILDPEGALVDPGSDPADAVVDRPVATLPRASAGWEWKKPSYTMTGSASWYRNGTTAMRLPRGTVIVICGARGCIERVVNDYGPAKYTGRIVDMYRPDFFAICGCGWWSGTTTVTIWVY